MENEDFTEKSKNPLDEITQGSNPLSSNDGYDELDEPYNPDNFSTDVIGTEVFCLSEEERVNIKLTLDTSLNAHEKTDGKSILFSKIVHQADQTIGLK